MTENLKVTHYNNGDEISTITTWGTWTGGAYADYDNNSDNSEIYGRIYNYSIANGWHHDVCPTGWHIPTDDEFKILEMTLGMSQLETDDTGWRGIDEGSKFAGNGNLWNDGELENNSEFGTSGFNGLPSGYRYYISENGYNYGSFQDMSTSGYFWTSTTQSSGSNGNRWIRSIDYNSTKIYRDVRWGGHFGYSIRCLRD